jgi:hypothetical protein
VIRVEFLLVIFLLSGPDFLSSFLSRAERRPRFVLFLPHLTAHCVRFPAISPREEALGDFCFRCSSPGSLTVLLLRFFSQFFLLVPAAASVACDFFQLRFSLAVLASEIWFGRTLDPFLASGFCAPISFFPVVPRAHLAISTGSPGSCFRFEFPPVRPVLVSVSNFHRFARPRCKIRFSSYAPGRGAAAATC